MFWNQKGLSDFMLYAQLAVHHKLTWEESISCRNDFFHNVIIILCICADHVFLANKDLNYFPISWELFQSTVINCIEYGYIYVLGKPDFV